MQRLEVSGAVLLIYRSFGVKGLTHGPDVTSNTLKNQTKKNNGQISVYRGCESDVTLRSFGGTF